MGQGGYLWIVNATSRSLKLSGARSSQMNSWNFTDISANSQQRFYVEFEESVVHTDDGGDANYQLEGTDAYFQLQARFNQDARGRQLQVDWSGTDTSQFTVFPPPTSGSTVGSIGWIHNGTLCVLFQEKKIVLPSRPALSVLGTQWMRYYSDVIGNLTLTEMCLPGTHDSGTYQPDFPLGREWIRTQSLSLRDQLNLGIRVIDLRIGQNSPGDYIISHDSWRTRYSLGQALKDVTDFILANSKELVVLDFHRFNNLGKGDFDFVQLKAQVKDCLRGLSLPVAGGSGKTLSELWQGVASGQQRVVVTWNDASIDSSYMWPGINQHWYSAADGKAKLYAALERDFNTPPSRDAMWSSCVFRTVSVLQTPFVNAQELKPDVDNWFHGCADWSLKANILSTDFCPDFNNVIHASICACLVNAGRK